MFPAHMASVHEAHANSLYVRDVFKAETVGILYLNIPEDRAAVKAMHEVFDPAGIKVVKEIPLEVEDPERDGQRGGHAVGQPRPRHPLRLVAADGQVDARRPRPGLLAADGRDRQPLRR